MNNKAHRLDGVVSVIQSDRPNADILVPEYDSSSTSTANPLRLTRNLVQCVSDAADEKGGYDDITLVGYSIGGLFLRKVYISAQGFDQDGISITAPRSAWADKVHRIVLLAGMNNGWSVSPKPEFMHWYTAAEIRLLEWILPNSTGRMMRSLKEGSPFVVDLQIDWMRMARSALSMPLTIQLLGDKDDVVRPEDSTDLLSGMDFVYLELPGGTDHEHAVDFTGDTGKKRERDFHEALTWSQEQLKTKKLIVPPKYNPDSSITQVVFLVHGIRDFGDWTSDLAAEFQKRSPHTKALSPGYGWFPMGKFLFKFEREKNVRLLMHEYARAVAQYPNARTFSFVGHSNGTYLLASAIRNYHSATWDRAVLAGSVLPKSFDWQSYMPGKIQRVKNYEGSADWVVGWFPKLYEMFGSKELGSAGFDGFLQTELKDDQVQRVKGQHGAALTKDIYPSMVSFILKDSSPVPIPADRLTPDKFWLVDWLSRVCWLVWLALIFIIGYAGYVFVRPSTLANIRPAFMHRDWQWIGAKAAGYIALLVALLNTV